MNIISNADIARKYNISRPTVTRWVELAQEGKNNLQVTLSNKKVQILDNPHNEAEIKRLLEEGKKYKRNVPLKKSIVKKEFYSIFNEEEIIEILNDLEFKKEVNLKYSYKNGGAEYWDKRYSSGMSPIKRATLETTQNLTGDIVPYLYPNKKINIIDIAQGNSHPVKHLVSELLSKSLLNKYVAIDISPEMLEISEKNMRDWFPEINYVSYLRDIEMSRFGKIFLENKTFSDEKHNLILFIGNTISNYDDRVQLLKNLRNGMTNTDLLAVTFTLDTESNRSVLNYAKSSDADLHHTWILDMLGIDLEDCEIELAYDAKNNLKYKTVKLDKDYELTFEILGEKKILSLSSRDEICVWKHYLLEYQVFMEELKLAKLEMVTSRKDSDFSNAMILCKAVF